MTSDIITPLHYTDLWCKSSHRQTKKNHHVYISTKLYLHKAGRGPDLPILVRLGRDVEGFGFPLTKFKSPGRPWAALSCSSGNQVITRRGVGSSTCFPDHCPGPEFLASRRPSQRNQRLMKHQAEDRKKISGKRGRRHT